MRTVEKEYLEHLKNTPGPMATILNSRPDYTQLEKDANDFETWIKSEHENDRILIKKSLQAAHA